MQDILFGKYTTPAVVCNPIDAADSQQSLRNSHKACSGLEECSLALSVEVNHAHAA